MPVVIVPPPYQGPTKGVGRVEVAAESVRDAILDMEERYPGFGPQIFSDEGGLHRFVKIFCNGAPNTRTRPHLSAHDRRFELMNGG